jgi:hypothetical protein
MQVKLNKQQYGTGNTNSATVTCTITTVQLTCYSNHNNTSKIHYVEPNRAAAYVTYISPSVSGIVTVGEGTNISRCMCDIISEYKKRNQKLFLGCRKFSLFTFFV